MSTASRQGPWPSLSRFLHSPTVDTILQPSVQFGDANQPWRLHLKVKANRGFFSFTVLVGDPAAQITARTSPGSPAVRLVMRAPHQQETPPGPISRQFGADTETRLQIICALWSLLQPWLRNYIAGLYNRNHTGDTMVHGKAQSAGCANLSPKKSYGHVCLPAGWIQHVSASA